MNPPRSGLAYWLPILLLGAATLRGAVAWPEAMVADFTDRHCSSCHNDVDKEGGLDLTALTYSPADPANFQLWVKVHDRVQTGEMPPAEKTRPPAAAIEAFVSGISTALSAHEQDRTATAGRSTVRRLNRYEYENALRDLFQAPWLQVKAQLPEDGEAFRFNKVSRALDVSHVHMSRYMVAAEYAIRQVMNVELTRPERTVKRYYARDEPQLSRNFELHEFNSTPERTNFPVLNARGQPDVRAGRAPVTVGEANPEVREQEAIGKVASTFADFGQYSWTQFRAPVAARYRVRFKGYTIWVGNGTSRRMWRGAGANKKVVELPFQWFRPNTDDISPGRRDEPMTVYAQMAGGRRRLGSFDFRPEPSISELEFVLQQNETITTDPSRFYRSRTTGEPYGARNPLAEIDGMPGVAVQWIEVDGPIYDESSGAGYRLLFDDLPLQRRERGQPGFDLEVVAPPARGGGRGPGGGRGGPPLQPVTVDVGTQDPAADAERLLRRFMQRAYRRPVEERDVQRFLAVIRGERERGLTFVESMIAGYTAVLASPGFVFVEEPAGRLGDHALATRLALFLWNSEPDETLRGLAARGELGRPDVLRAQTERLLNDARSRRFSDAFLDYWIDLRKIDDTSPSSTLYNDYELDEPLKDAAVDETRLFFAEMIDRNLPVRTIVDSDFTFLNERLAQHYGIAGVNGAAMRRVTLPADSPRGGLMTQASVLKITANGTTTSPVLRGVWISERILGETIPMPPASVPAVEPDIRGAVTIRQQLAKHSADESCAACHRKIDPPGFALESFDVMGGWRSRYRAESPDVEPEPGYGFNGWPFLFHYALPVESHGSLPDGRAFSDVKDFKRLLLADEPKLARNVARQLVIFATGAPIRFSDRARIEALLTETRSTQYGMRSLIHAVVQSDMFRHK